jgi:hypothetical protein
MSTARHEAPPSPSTQVALFGQETTGPHAPQPASSAMQDATPPSSHSA